MEKEQKGLTKNGYAFDEVTSAVQKEIRYGNEEKAVFWALELYETAPHYLWKRLMVIASEDIGLASPETVVLVNSLAAGWEIAKKFSWFVSPHQAIQAVMALCRAPKSTEVEDCISYLVEKRKLGFRLAVPDYAVDGHTKRGKAMGKGGQNWSDWYHFRHVTAKIPLNDYTRKLAELDPQWFDEETLKGESNV